MKLVPAGEQSVKAIHTWVREGRLPQDTQIPAVILDDNDPDEVAGSIIYEVQGINVVALSEVQAGSNGFLSSSKVLGVFNSPPFNFFPIVISKHQWVDVNDPSSKRHIFSIDQIREVLSRGPVQVLTDERVSDELRVLAAALIRSAA